MARPPSFQTPDEFNEKADAYFEGIGTDKIPTVNGLCYALGICRDTLWEYAKKPEFSDAVKSARTRLEMAWEERLTCPNVAGAIFWLKNQGWSDKTEQVLSGSVDTVTRIELVAGDNGQD